MHMLRSTVCLDYHARKIVNDAGYPSLSYFIRLKIKELSAEKATNSLSDLTKPHKSENYEDSANVS